MIYSPWLSPCTCVQGHCAGEGLAPRVAGCVFLSAAVPGWGLLRPQATSPVGKMCAPLALPRLGDGDNVLSAFPSQTTSRLEGSGTVFMNI